MVIKHKVTIKTKQPFRKPKIETFKGFWNSEEDVRQIVAKYRPDSEILKIERIYPDTQVIFEVPVNPKVVNNGVQK